MINAAPDPKAILLDIDGVIYVGDQLLPGALDAMARLRSSGLPIRFITNTTLTPRSEIFQRLSGMGVELSIDELLTPAAAACDWLNAHGLRPHLLVHPALESEFAGVATKGDAIAVVVGDAGDAFTYQALNAAFRHLVAGAPFIALAANRTFKDKDGELSIDAGAFVAALEYASGRQAVVLGKPSADFFQAAVASMNAEATHTVMVGDDAEADVSGALKAGLGYGLLVRTGKYRSADEAAVSPPPTAVVESLSEAADWILSRLA